MEMTITRILNMFKMWITPEIKTRVGWIIVKGIPVKTLVHKSFPYTERPPLADKDPFWYCEELKRCVVEKQDLFDSKEDAQQRAIEDADRKIMYWTSLRSSLLGE